MEFQGYIERLKTVFINESYADEIKLAKDEFIAAGGELGNGIEGYQEALDIFFDWYIFERLHSIKKLTPLQLFLRDNDISNEDRRVYSDFINHIQCILLIKKINITSEITNEVTKVKVLDIFNKNKYLVEGISLPLLEKDEVVEARLLPFMGGYRFSGAFSFYPKNSYKIMKAGVKEKRRAGIKDYTSLIQKFRKLKIMCDMCSNMDIKKVYKLMEEGMLA